MPVSAPARWWQLVLGGLAYGFITFIALPPVGLWPLALAAIVPLAWAGCRMGRRRFWGSLCVGLGTFPFWFAEHWWMREVTAPGFPVLAAYLSLYSALFAWMIATVRATDWPIPMSLAVPVAWTGIEVLRGEIVFTGYAWFLAAHPLIDSPALSAPAAVLGTYFVSFLCAALAGAVVDAAGWSGLPRRVGGIGAVAWVFVWGVSSWLGARVRGPEPAMDLRVAVVQTNLTQSNKISWPILSRFNDLQNFLDITRQAASVQPRPDVIVWPETMFPGPALNPGAVQQFRDGGVFYRIAQDGTPSDGRLPAAKFHDDLVRMQSELGPPLLVGSITIEGDLLSDMAEKSQARHSSKFNSAVLVHRGQVREDRYDKVELMAFGEFIPYVWRWPWLQQRVLDLGAEGMAFDLTAGTKERGLDLPLGTDRPVKFVRIATPICFEVTRADLCRRLVAGDGTGRAVAIITLSNDGWFGTWDAGRWQHLLAARWRCVELGVPMVRAVNTGVSTAIDRRGQITSDQLVGRSGDSARVEGVLPAIIRVGLTSESPVTLYERVGNVPAYIVLGATVAGIPVFWIRRRRLARSGG